MRIYILTGFILIFALIHKSGTLNKYINTKYSYLSVIAIVLLALLWAFEVIRSYLAEKEKECSGATEGAETHLAHGQAVEHAHNHDHRHSHEFHGHTHSEPSRWKRGLGYLILAFPIVTGIFFPVETLDSSFVKAKGFSFPSIENQLKSPGNHQFLKPDVSIFYGEEGYRKLADKNLSELVSQKEIHLNDDNFLKNLEVIYNSPATFMGRSISYDGFVYTGDQVDNNHYFVFRFGFIHCVADSGVYGMLVEFPEGTVLHDDEWIHVTGTLSSELYPPFKQTIPKLKATSWKDISEPVDPYVYRLF